MVDQLSQLKKVRLLGREAKILVRIYLDDDDVLNVEAMSPEAFEHFNSLYGDAWAAGVAKMFRKWADLFDAATKRASTH